MEAAVASHDVERPLFQERRVSNLEGVGNFLGASAVRLEVDEFLPRIQCANLRIVGTGVSRSYETAPPKDPTAGLCLGPNGGPRGGLLFLMREVPP